MNDITAQDMIDLLNNEVRERAVVAMVAHGDSEEHDYAADMLARKVKVIRATISRVEEMTAVEYLKAKQDMCISHTCDKCPLASSAYEDSCRCTEMYKQDKAIRIVKKWKEDQDGH